MLDTRKKAIALAAGVAAAAMLSWVFMMTAERAVSLICPDCLLCTHTGLKCFLCGGTRCARAITEGDFAEAFYFNPFVMICAAVAILLYVRLLTSVFAKDYKPIRISKKLLWVFLAAIILFTVVRNLGFYQSIFY